MWSTNRVLCCRLVLMDVQMPVLGGIETTKDIRASDELWRTIPVIASTTHAMEATLKTCWMNRTG